MGKKKLFKKTWQKVVCVILVVALAAGGFAFYRFNSMKKNFQGMAANMPSMAKVRETRVSRMTLNESIGTSGTIQSQTSKNLSTTITKTTVKSVNVKVGDYVEVGDIICTFEDTDITEELQSAQANYQLAVLNANLNLTKSEQNLETASSNVTLKVQNAQDSVDNYAKKLSEARENLNDAKKDLETYKLQYENALSKYPNFVSEYESNNSTITTYNNYLTAAKSQLEVLNTQYQEYQDGACKTYTDGASGYPTKCSSLYNDIQDTNEQISNYNLIISQAKAKVNAYANEYAAKTNYEKAQNSVETYQEQITTYQKNYDDALRTLETTKQDVQNSLTSAEINLLQQQNSNSVDSAKNTLEKAQEKYDDIVYRASVAGTVTSINVEEGEEFTGGTVITVQDVDSLMVEASLDEYDIIEVEVGQKVIVKTNATGDNEYDGVVTFVSLVPTTSAGGMGSSSSVTYKVRIEILNPDEDFRLGMSAKLSIITSEANNVLVVPYTAIKSDEKGNEYITIKNDNGEEQNVYVSVGVKGDYYYQIETDVDVENKVLVIDSSSASSTSEAANGMMPGMGITGGMGGNSFGGGSRFSGGKGGGPSGGF